MTTVLKFVDIIEFNIIDKNYQLLKHKEDIITYYWCQKNLIFDILIKENICAINNNNNSSWFSLDYENIKNILLIINK